MLGGSTTQVLPSTKPAVVGVDTSVDLTQLPVQGSKLRMSIEKKIENIWLDSQELGWSYNDFVTHLLEILIILNYRTCLPKADSNEQGLNVEAAAP
jgi:hypothetical protein